MSLACAALVGIQRILTIFHTGCSTLLLHTLIHTYILLLINALKPKQSYFSLCSDTVAEVEIPANSLRSQVFVSLSETETNDVDLETNPPNTEYISNIVELNPRVSSLVTSAFLSGLHLAVKLYVFLQY